MAIIFKTVTMKNKTFIPALVLSVGLGFSACNGDHSTRVDGDTVSSVYKKGFPTMDSTKQDTSSRVTTQTGDASDIDNSASGGVKIAKDTSKIKKP